MRIPVSVALAFFLVGCFDATCDGGDPEAEMARALSSERLKGLHDDAMLLADGDYWPKEIPKQFKDLDPVAIRSRTPGILVVRLRGCMDHHLDLVVFGRDASLKPGAPRIELWYNERPRQEEKLWESSE